MPQSNGGQFVGQSSVPQMVVGAIIELKPKSMAKAVRQIDKKGRDATFEAKQNVGKNPHKIKVRPWVENMKR